MKKYSIQDKVVYNAVIDKVLCIQCSRNIYSNNKEIYNIISYTSFCLFSPHITTTCDDQGYDQEIMWNAADWTWAVRKAVPSLLYYNSDPYDLLFTHYIIFCRIFLIKYVKQNILCLPGGSLGIWMETQGYRQRQGHTIFYVF